ncbi:G6F-like protein precursor [Oryzias latipes]|uniref:G6f-like n=1 Tax=Oryzias latipes TaxID=8090 RepID=E0XMD0_ORYLA|nr:g6f-like precursor [Oryzias latipes]ADM15539.1 G6F-like protein [Oryzias latipes]
MESAFLTFILVFFLTMCSSQIGTTDLNDVVVAEENMPTTLGCTDTTAKGDISISWMVKSLSTDEWKLLLTATERNNFSGASSRASMQLLDRNFKDSGVFSLYLVPTVEDSGLYTCLIKQKGRKLKERIHLLAILRVRIVPAPPLPQHSTLRLIAKVTPENAVTKITWTAPSGMLMKTELKPNTGVVAKLPQIQTSDRGTYVCSVYSQKNSSRVFATQVEVTVDAGKVAEFKNATHGSMIFTGVQAQKPYLLTCPDVPGDLVVLHRLPADVKKREMKVAHEYDRWRDFTFQTDQSKRLRLAGPPFNAKAGIFSFLLTPELKDGGLYVCEVSLNDNIFSQWTTLSVLKVKTRYYASRVELLCLYSELSQVQSAKWKHHNESRRLEMSSSKPGCISTVLPSPITPETAGNYTCSLQLQNGQVIQAVQAVTLPLKESVSVTTPSPLPSLSALLLLVPLVAAAVGVLLWRQKHISDRGIEQSLSVHSGEAENIYENPADIRQAPPQGSVYMDLKPRGEDDVYKELERYEQCQG